MKKKKYETPAAEVVVLNQKSTLLAGSTPNQASIDDYKDGEFSWEARENDFEDFLQDENSQY